MLMIEVTIHHTRKKDNRLINFGYEYVDTVQVSHKFNVTRLEHACGTCVKSTKICFAPHGHTMQACMIL